MLENKEAKELLKLYTLQEQSEDQEDYEKFTDACKELLISEDEIRQLVQMIGTYSLGVLVFDQLINVRQFSKDFLVELFSNCERSTKDTLQFILREHMWHFNFDLVNKDIQKTRLDFLLYRNEFKNICKYVYYCNPIRKDILDIYYEDFKYNETFKKAGGEE